MANLTKRISKNGQVTYLIRVYEGRASNGKQLFRTITYVPEKGMTEKQIEKEANKQAVLFEQAVQNGSSLSDKTTFKDFSDRWFESYALTQLRPTTFRNYRNKIDIINEAIGHIQLNKLKPQHLLDFYKNLSEEGVKQNQRYVSAKLKAEMKKQKLTQEALSKASGVAVTSIRSMQKGSSVMESTATKISDAMGIPLKKLFKNIVAPEKLSNSTIQYYHHVISSILSTAVEWQVIPFNPAERVKPPKHKYIEASHIEEDELIEILNALNDEEPHIRCFITLLIASGLRRGEAIALEWKDIDFTKNTIDITKSRLYTPADGMFVDEPKNDSSKRKIKIPEFAMTQLSEWKKVQFSERLSCGNEWHKTITDKYRINGEFKTITHNNDYVFTSWNGTPVFNSTPATWLKKFIKKYNATHPDNELSNEIHLHTFRHTNISMLIAEGVDIKTVSSRAGHSNVQTTGVIYSHSLKSADESASDKLDDFFNTKVNPQKKSVTIA